MGVGVYWVVDVSVYSAWCVCCMVFVSSSYMSTLCSTPSILPHHTPCITTQVAGILQGDAQLVGKALGSETIVEPVRGPLIPGFLDVKHAAVEAGAYGCTISGAGPTAVAIVGSAEEGKQVARAMQEAFEKKGGLAVNSVNIVQLDKQGARAV